MNLIIIRKFNPMFERPGTWNAFTFLILLAYAIGVFYFKLSFFNYYFLSLVIGFQLYYWISNQEETFEFNGNDLIYNFLFIKKKIQIKSYQLVHIRYDKNPHSRTRENVYTECLMIQDEKVRFSFIKTIHPKDYAKIRAYLVSNFSENKTVKKPFVIFKFVPDFFLFFAVVFLFTVIFTIGILIENKKESKIERFVYIESISIKNSEIIKGRRNSLSMNLKLEKYPKEFRIFDEGIIELKRNNVSEFDIGDTIGLYLDRQDYYRKLKQIEDYPYFTSHLINKNKINVKGIFYKKYHVIGPYETAQGDSRREYLFILLPLIFLFVCLINIFSNKIKGNDYSV